jgi:CRISPR-associated endonuclease/helicase Cas3
MRELANEWSSHIVLASGSLVRFWEFADFSETKDDVPDLLPESLQEKAREFESQRVAYPVRKTPLNRHELIGYVLSKSGPRLVILNTVQSAAVLAHELRRVGHQVIHLSTALAPIDRNEIIKKVHAKLRQSTDSSWTLVATSCVEAGVDFSFKTAFRESCSVTSLIQTGGRANRQGSELGCEVIDFRVRDPLLNKHPAFETSRTVLDQMFDAGLMNTFSPMELATESIKRELGKNSVKTQAELIKKMELRQEYRDVARLTRIIDADTRTVVVKQSIIERLNNREKVLPIDLLQNSVQLWSNKISKLGLTPFEHYKDIYSLGGYKYDSEFLGYMEGLLPLVYQYEEGLII